MKVLIAGAGAIGCWLGARLADSGQEVTLLGRPALRDAVAQDGLRVVGLTEFHGAMPIITEAGGGPYDLIIITSKSTGTAALAEATADLLAPRGVLMTLQNGLGNAELLMQHAGNVVVGTTSHGVMVEAPGTVRHAGTGMMRIGPAPGHAPGMGLDRVAAAFDAAGLAPEVVEDIVPHLWLKGAVNAGLNPLGAIYGVPNGGLAEHLGEAEELTDEVVSLSRAAGVRMPGDAVQALRDTIAKTAANKCSMLQDVEARRATEIDHITGYFVRVARRLGYPLFANEDIYLRVKEIEKGYLGEDASNALTKAAAQAFTW